MKKTVRMYQVVVEGYGYKEIDCNTSSIVYAAWRLWRNARRGMRPHMTAFSYERGRGFSNRKRF